MILEYTLDASRHYHKVHHSAGEKARGPLGVRHAAGRGVHLGGVRMHAVEHFPQGRRLPDCRRDHVRARRLLVAKVCVRPDTAPQPGDVKKPRDINRETPSCC
eukprot:8392706-Pyramimonas_sp.AAC.1